MSAEQEDAKNLVDKILQAPEWEEGFNKVLAQLLTTKEFQSALAKVLECAVEQERGAGALDFTDDKAPIKAAKIQGISVGMRRAVDIITDLAKEKEKEDE